MFSWIRRRATYANVAMTLALMFAMTGGAYAAKKYLITSTKQISPSVLKQLVGKVGPAGVNGKDGAPGAQGPQGPAGKDGANGKDGAEGPAGPKGATGATGQQGVKGTNGTNGTNGATGPAGEVNTEGPLPVGKTETGGWAAGGSAFANGFQVVMTAISFPIRLSADLPTEKVQANPPGYPTGATTEQEEHCPGSAAEPKAASGFLCVYTTKLINSAIPVPNVEKLTSPLISEAPGASATGAQMTVLRLKPEEPVAGWGTWAVTG